MKMKKILSLFILFGFFYSCTEKVIEIPEFNPPETNKVVLIEELTGVKCINCPGGAKTIKGLEKKYEGKVISLAIHAGDLSEPYPENKYDLRCEDGIKLESKLQPYIGKPAAAIDRIQIEAETGIPISGYGGWAAEVEKSLNEENVLNMGDTITYDHNTREIKVYISIFPLKDLDGNFKLNVALTESNIVDLQVEKEGLNENYVFDNVLRDMLTPFDGENLGSDLKKNVLLNKVYTYTLPESDGTWIPENMKIIAYVTGGIEDSFYPVLNAVEGHIIQ